MIGDRQSIKAGAESTNMQAQTITVINDNGVTYSEARQIFLDLFEANFYKLQGTAVEVAEKRAEEITKKIMNEFCNRHPDKLETIKDPDTQCAIYEAQKGYVRSGDKGVANLLVDLLVERTIKQEESFKKVILNEAIQVVPKLTTRHIDTLSFIYVVNYLYFPNATFDVYLPYFRVFAKDFKIQKSDFFYTHLEYCGCIKLHSSSKSIEGRIMERVVGMDNLYNNLCLTDELRHLYYDMHYEKNIPKSALSSVGLAIAIINLKTKFKFNDVDLDIYL